MPVAGTKVSAVIVPRVPVMAERHASFVESYGSRYPENVVAVRSSGSEPVQMHRLRQPAGYYEVASEGNLAISLALNGGFSAELDVGTGKFSQTWPQQAFAVVTPNAVVSTFNLDAKLDALNLSVPFSRVQPILRAAIGQGSADAFEPLHTRGVVDTLTASLLLNLWIELAEQGPRGALFVDQALGVLVHRLLRIAEAPVKKAGGGLAPWQVKRVCEAMIATMDHGEQEASLAELALLVGLSANHFCRSFAQSTGQPPHRWMTERRVERAKVLMTDPRLGLTEIALAVGYTSQSTLGRTFARVAGMTPSEWRRTLAD